MDQQFIGRRDELAFLERKYNSNAAEFVVIYGRRRVGKTELIHQFTGDRPHLYYQCERTARDAAVGDYQRYAARVLEATTFGRLRLPGWYELFEELIGILPDLLEPSTPDQQRKFIIVLDEFPYLAESDPGVTSAFQKAWDGILSRAPVMLILCGSSIGMMEREVLSAKSPLFGRRTGQIHLTALSPFEIRPFVPDYSFADIVRTYAVCDGIPAYLGKFDPSRDFAWNLRHTVLDKNEYLYAEGEFLLKSEFRDYRNYFLILSLMAGGKRSFNDITTASGLDKGLVSKYLSNLEALRFVVTDLPVTVVAKRARKKRYRLSDYFIMFWFRFIYSNRHLLEEFGSMELADIEEDFNTYLGGVFEGVCREYVRRKYGQEYPLVGAWWNRRGDEIDVAALDATGRRGLLGECKWSSRLTGVEQLQGFMEKRTILETEHALRQVRYMLFSREGFTGELRTLAGERDDVELVGMDELEGLNGG